MWRAPRKVTEKKTTGHAWPERNKIFFMNDRGQCSKRARVQVDGPEADQRKIRAQVNGKEIVQSEARVQADGPRTVQNKT